MNSIFGQKTFKTSKSHKILSIPKHAIHVLCQVNKQCHNSNFSILQMLTLKFVLRKKYIIHLQYNIANLGKGNLFNVSLKI